MNNHTLCQVFPPAPPPGVRSNVDQNLPAGVVVDTAAVNPELNEFYLQSHKALQVHTSSVSIN